MSNEESHEAERSSEERGIVRNSRGRIIETGWPTVPKREWPNAFKEIGKSISGQIKVERALGKYAEKDVFGALRLGRLVFNLNAVEIAEGLKAEVAKKMNDTSGYVGKIVRLCDVGGGGGALLGNVALHYKGKFKEPNKFDRELETTLTRLSVLGRYDLRDSNQEYVDRVVTTSIELPPDNFYEAFDIIAAQNSVYYWSQCPELATLNLWKMLRRNGIVVATVPVERLELDDESFDVMQYLQTSKIFSVEKLGMITHTRTPGYIVRMEKEQI